MGGPYKREAARKGHAYPIERNERGIVRQIGCVDRVGTRRQGRPLPPASMHGHGASVPAGGRLLRETSAGGTAYQRADDSRLRPEWAGCALTRRQVRPYGFLAVR